MISFHHTIRLAELIGLISVLLLPNPCNAIPQNRYPAPSSHCNDRNMQVRKEWGSLSKWDRKAYTDAVLCLQQQPSKIPARDAPGALSRYDDFTAVHINMTLRVHSGAWFLVWHRHFIYLLEQALTDECGFNGTVPYWNWPLWQHSLEASPLFDGSPYSLSGNGVHNASTPPYPIGPNFSLPPGTGGGCVTSGPFKDLVVPFHHISIFEIFMYGGVVPKSDLGYNPHCFSRDLNDAAAQNFTNQGVVDYLLYNTTNIVDFSVGLNGVPIAPMVNPHIGGHLSGGGDLFDFFTSPADPAFYLHHAMLDLIWSGWQFQDPKTRQYALYGTTTTFNIPPSANGTVNDVLSFGVLGVDQKLGDLMSITDGPYCYRYDYDYKFEYGHGHWPWA